MNRQTSRGSASSDTLYLLERSSSSLSLLLLYCSLTLFFSTDTTKVNGCPLRAQEPFVVQERNAEAV